MVNQLEHVHPFFLVFYLALSPLRRFDIGGLQAVFATIRSGGMGAPKVGLQADLWGCKTIEI